VVLVAASCGFPALPDFPGGDSGGGGTSGSDGGTSGSDGGMNDGGSPGLDLELLAGDADGPGSVDGTGAAARFTFPTGVAVDGAGNVYVADQHNDTIRKITPAGVVTTLAGTAGQFGSADDTGAAAGFFAPSSVAVDGAGNVYVTDQGNCTIRKITPAGVVTTLAGTPGMRGSADGTGADARFNFPTGVAVDGAGNVYVADQESSTLRKITPAGVVTTLAGSAGVTGSADGTGADARFDFPTGVAVDGTGNVYVADQNNDTIRKVTPQGVVTTLAGIAGAGGSADGTGSAARFFVPTGVAVDSAGNVYVVDQGNVTLRKITPAGVVTTLAGTRGRPGSTDGTGTAARFDFPTSVAVDSTGTVYVSDTDNASIRKVTAAGVVTTLAGPAGASGSKDGTGTAARLFSPAGVAVDGAGTMYVADTDNSTIRTITPAGVVTTLAGTSNAGGSVDGTGAGARFGFPAGVAVDTAGTIYVADTGNSTIRKATPAGVVTTLAGSARMPGSADGTGAAARFSEPADVAVDSAGNVYVADQGNATIRKITPAGVVTTLAGSAGVTGGADGTGAAARFESPNAIAVDSTGNVYVADQGNAAIRKVTAAGVVTTLAGTAGAFIPMGVAVDRAGTVYVTEKDRGAIHRVTPTGANTVIFDVTSAVRGPMAGAVALTMRLAILGDSLVITYYNSILVLHHGAR
jgi:hypothetical protein